MTILVTGAAGFIGSHFARTAHDAGFRVVALDDLSTSIRWPRIPEAIERIEGDVGNRALIAHIMTSRDIKAIVHFAGRIRVEESIKSPALYFEQNLEKTLALLDAATWEHKRPLPFVLSSSAAVYGEASVSPLKEQTALRPINPYGASKLAAETALSAYGYARGLCWAALRYFNVAGAHPDGSLRESHDPETHLVPLAIDAARGTSPALTVHGDDYATRDGTCERDYIHVMDLAEAHLQALTALDHAADIGVLNLGSGCGVTVQEVLSAVSSELKRPVPHKFGPRRAGDPDSLVACVSKASEKLSWCPRRGFSEIVSDTLRSRAA